MDDEVTALLRRAADAGGEFVPPDVAVLATRGRRRTVTRTACAVVAVVVLVVGLAVGLHLGEHSSTRPAARPSSVPSQAPSSAPAGPSLSELEGGRWSSLPKAPIEPRLAAATAWTGSQVLIWGGTVYGKHSHDVADGASYTPATHRWQLLPRSPLSARGGMAFAWTGSVLFVWGGGSAPARADGATYDPRTHRWQMLPPAPVPSYYAAEAVSIDGKVVLITSRRGDTRAIHAAEYDPETNRWAPLPDLDLPAGHELFYPMALAAGDQIFVWSLWSNSTPHGHGGFSVESGTDGYVFDPVTQAWAAAPIDADRGSDVGTPVWTGSRVLLAGEGIYCGSCSHPPTETFRGVSIDPVTGARTEMATRGVGVVYPDYVWTGSFLVGFNESYRGPNLPRGATAAWDPRTNTWTDLPQAPPHSGNQVTVWTGHSLLAWTSDGALLQFAPR